MQEVVGVVENSNCTFYIKAVKKFQVQAQQVNKIKEMKI